MLPAWRLLELSASPSFWLSVRGPPKSVAAPPFVQFLFRNDWRLADVACIFSDGAEMTWPAFSVIAIRSWFDGVARLACFFVSCKKETHVRLNAAGRVETYSLDVRHEVAFLGVICFSVTDAICLVTVHFCWLDFNRKFLLWLFRKTCSPRFLRLMICMLLINNRIKIARLLEQELKHKSSAHTKLWR